MKKIVVIEDSPDVQEIIAETLRFQGFEVFTASDGSSGVEVARQQLPDLIICDIHMPRMDGYDTLAALRKDAATSVIPFIFLSGIADRSNVRRGMSLGADDYLTKPFTTDELMAAVSARLEKQAELHRRSERKLEELRGNLTMALPHELRTPLNGILGLSSLLMEDGANMAGAQVLETARYIHQSAQRLHRLIENFLVYAQIELILADPERTRALRQVPPTEVGSLVAQAAEETAKKAGRMADLQLALGSTTVAATEEHLKKVVEELVSNAFKFSEAGSPVRVETNGGSGQFVLTVEDRGRGMTPAQVASVGAHMQFGREFYEQQGAGLGLIIAKRLTELGGGELRIESAPGLQTIVRAVYPLGSPA